MGKIKLIIWREYFTRVSKKSFIIMTILGPLLIASFYGVMIYLIVNENIGAEQDRVFVYDQSGLFEENLKDTRKIDYIFQSSSDSINKDALSDSAIAGWLVIPDSVSLYSPKGIYFESKKSLSVQNASTMENGLEKVIRQKKMAGLGVSKGKMDSLRTKVSVTALKYEEGGKTKATNTGLNAGIGIGMSMAIYFFIFIYGVQVMRGVIEEKTNRIVEVIVSSVKPFQLMMGKVIGLAMVGLTQILIWIILTGGLMLIFSYLFMGSAPDMAQMQDMAKDMPMDQVPGGEMTMGLIKGIQGINFQFLVFAFLFYFLGGYLMYSALFAAVGAAVDAETDTQQFMLPITLPLIFSIVLATSVVMQNPNGTLSFWLSIIPFSSPIVMLVRAPFLNLADQWWEVALSMGVLILSFCFMIWLAGRIYRVGILMYGKKTSYKELFKWISYRG
jgi:ABC-2 type transport system permease protein